MSSGIRKFPVLLLAQVAWLPQPMLQATWPLRFEQLQAELLDHSCLLQQLAGPANPRPFIDLQAIAPITEVPLRQLDSLVHFIPPQERRQKSLAKPLARQQGQ